MIPNDISGSRLPARNWGFMKAHEGWRVAKPKARKWDSKDKGGKDKQKVRKYMKVWNEWQEQIQLPLLLENATLSRRSSLIIASNLCLHKGFQNLQHQTAPDSTWQHLKYLKLFFLIPLLGIGLGIGLGWSMWGAKITKCDAEDAWLLW